MRLVYSVFLTCMMGLIHPFAQAADSNGYAWSAIPEEQRRTLGVMVGYSELCAEFDGTVSPNLALRSIKKFFEGSVAFDNGYRSQVSLIGYDIVHGLDQCDDVNDRLQTLSEKLP